MNRSLSMNILRLGLILIFIGIFLPIGCKSNGYEIAQGILGNAKFGNTSAFLSPVADVYGFLLFGVFALALVAFLVSLMGNMNNTYMLAFLLFGISAVFVVLILMNFKIYFNFNDFSFYLRILGGIKLKLELAGYGMVVGYLLGFFSFILRILGR